MNTVDVLKVLLNVILHVLHAQDHHHLTVSNVKKVEQNTMDIVLIVITHAKPVLVLKIINVSHVMVIYSCMKINVYHVIQAV